MLARRTRLDAGFEAAVRAVVIELLKEQGLIVFNAEQAFTVFGQDRVATGLVDPAHRVSDVGLQHVVAAQGEYAGMQWPQGSFQIAVAAVRE